ncbi:protein NRT1/ PTR FAMILY 2.13-like isoform X2 [Cicer arietinum]|uniref:Protein NRT1/ PTR FAMILY 2.13-like isoform X2 n=1 Tax=Cicer arietinum TaxID=3827 RepID=A0A3Q7X158_CICAR|nr:protein NRT1/ PTR FAMILY 2.13-like isoform X2 [Cicer arietinum]
MEVEKKKRNHTRSLWSSCCSNWNSKKSSIDEIDLDNSSNPRVMKERPGWKGAKYILGNETIERIATYGMQGNFLVYLLNVFHLSQVGAANIISLWIAVSNLIPMIGAIISDAFLGKFRTIVLASIGTLVGIVIITLTAWLPQLHPPTCNHHQVCVAPTSFHLSILIFGLSWLAIGTGGIRPCAIPFAIDQFDTNTLEGKKAEGSIFSGIAKVIVAAYKKHQLQFPSKEGECVYYDPPLEDVKALKMPLTKELRCLNKAAMIQDNEINPEGRVTNTWNLCSIQQVEELKCLIKIIPIWASGFLGAIPIVQQGIFPITQALKMDRHIGSFEIPAPSCSIVTLITIAIWLLFYDFFVQPALAKVTKQVEGIKSLQKIVIGNIFSILVMVSAGLVEWYRRNMAISNTYGTKPISAFWLAPQYIMLGFCEVFLLIGYIEFYNSESPQKMKSIGNSLHYLMLACSSYAGVLVINIVNKVTQRNGGKGWLNNDINVGRLDYYYFLISGLGAINLVYVIFCAKRYRYKVVVKAEVADSI